MNIARPRSELGSSGLRDMPRGMLNLPDPHPHIAPKARGSLRRKAAGWSRFRGERAPLPPRRPANRSAVFEASHASCPSPTCPYATRPPGVVLRNRSAPKMVFTPTFYCEYGCVLVYKRKEGVPRPWGAAPRLVVLFLTFVHTAVGQKLTEQVRTFYHRADHFRSTTRPCVSRRVTSSKTWPEPTANCAFVFTLARRCDQGGIS